MTISEIAKLCNVSAATVSNVINGKGRASRETVERIQKLIAETGYQPDFLGRSLRSHSTGLIGVIADDIVQFSVPPIIDGAMACCEERGYHLILENLRLYARWSDTWFGDEEKYQSVLQPALAQMRRFKVDGILYIGGHEREIHGIEQSASTPVVVAYAFPDTPRVPAFVIDDEQGGYMQTRYLLDRGHRRIGYIAAEPDNIHVINRVRGWRRALEEAGIQPEEALLSYGRWGRKSGYENTPRMLEAGVTAVLCAQDDMAGGVYDYLSEHGLAAGRELSVLGYDNSDIASFLKPSLTTISLPLYEIGFSAAGCLVNLINDRPIPTGSITQIPGELVERESVRPV